MKKIRFIRLEANYKYAVETEFINTINSIKNDYGGDIDEWWENRCLDEEMDLISDNGSYDENIMFYIEDESGKHHDINDFLSKFI